MLISPEEHINDAPVLEKTMTLRERQTTTMVFTLTIIGIITYLVFDVIIQLLPPHYNPLVMAESDLAHGPYGFLMDINFVIRGLLSFALVSGIILGTQKEGRSRVGLFFLSIWALASFLLAFFPDDITSQQFQAITSHGKIHIELAAIAFISISLAELFLSLRLSRDARLRSLRTIVLPIALLTCLTFLLLIPFGKLGVFGLGERLFLGMALLWIGIVALRMRRIFI